MAPEILILKPNKSLKVVGNYIKSDIYSLALSIIYCYNPKVSLSELETSEHEDQKIAIIRSKMLGILENTIKWKHPTLYSILIEMLKEN